MHDRNNPLPTTTPKDAAMPQPNDYLSHRAAEPTTALGATLNINALPPLVASHGRDLTQWLNLIAGIIAVARPEAPRLR